ncbi:MAG: M15 family metallopeptidase [Planctomycetes bacterium]|nr:M15 family metallopeptidase [Planctomycetota bacterium]
MARRAFTLLAGLALLLPLACASGRSAAERAALAAEPLVPVADVDPRIRFDMRYASANNFTGQVLYDSPVCLLRRSVAERLSRVQERLARQGLGLLVFDGYRPLSVQERMWQLVPDTRYVADPRKGSRHNRGAAVDVALVDRSGRPLEMPTDFDDLSEAARRGFPGASAAARQNLALLEAAMTAEGFIGLESEWWHYDAPDWEAYPVIGR